MKYTLLSAALFAGAIALPNSHAPRDEPNAPADPTSSSSDSVVTAHITKSTTVWYTGPDTDTETTQEKTSATTTIEKPAATNAEVCDGNMNSDTWKKYKLDSMLHYFLNSYPKNMHGPNPQDSKERSFLDYIANQVGQNIVCNVGSEDCGIIINPDTCKGARGDNLSPDLHFILWSIRNLHDWAEGLYREIKDSGLTMATRSNELMTTFTNSKATSADDGPSTKLNIAGSVLALLSPLMAAFPPLGIATGASSGAVLIGANTVSATQDTAADILNKDFKAAGSIEESITTITDISSRAVRDLASKAINEKITPSGDYPGNIWASYPWSAASLFENGTFADKQDAKNYKLTQDQFDKIFASAAINQAWRIDQAYIVKAKTIWNKPASELKLKYLHKESRICEDDGTCYFFIIARTLESSIPHHKWSNLKGLDKMDKYGIDKLKFAKDAEWLQDHSGDDENGPNYKDLADLLRNPDSDFKSYRYFVNLPVIDYEDTTTISDKKAWWPVKSYGLTAEEHFLNNVGFYSSSKKFKHWPPSYKKIA